MLGKIVSYASCIAWSESDELRDIALEDDFTIIVCK